MFWRIIFPIAIVAFFLAPWSTETVESKVAGETMELKLTGYDMVKPTLSCALGGTFSVAGECEPKGGAKGYILVAAAALAVLAIALHLVGFAGIIRKFASGTGLLAGLSALTGAGWIGLDAIGGVDQIADIAQNYQNIDWGAYGAGAAALITSIAGAMGMRSEDA